MVGSLIRLISLLILFCIEPIYNTHTRYCRLIHLKLEFSEIITGLI